MRRTGNIALWGTAASCMVGRGAALSMFTSTYSSSGHQLRKCSSSSAPGRLDQNGTPQLLNNEPLQQPEIYPEALDWKTGDSFTSVDDPDRCGHQGHGWFHPPGFLFEDDKGAIGQMNNIEFDVSSVDGFVAGTSFARAVEGVFTEKECQDLLKAVNYKGFTPALVNVGGDKQRFLPHLRDGLRVVHDVPTLTERLFHRIKPFLPTEMSIATTRRSGTGREGDKIKKSSLQCLNHRCRFLCYKPGQFFKPHRDGNQFHTGLGVSGVTVQLYLHDVDEVYGGATAFLSSSSPSSSSSSTTKSSYSKVLSYQPKAGSVLLFSQELVHEGVELKNGGIKYAMRTDAMYSSSS